MRRTLLAVVMAALIPFALAGCGGSTKTVTIGVSASGVSLSMVATGDSAGIDSAKKQASSAGGGGGANVTVTDGDTHSGAKVCETDVTDSSGTYHVVVYSDSTLITASVCDQMKSSSTH